MASPITLTPGAYHGFAKKPPFFEGWYYKLVSADEKHKLAIIPGVILGQQEHTFVQVLEGVSGATHYHRFPREDFRANGQKFELEVGGNQFSDHHLKLSLNNPQSQLTGEIQLGPLNPWPVTWTSPGVMGWYAWVPGMQTYHGVLSFSHKLQGALTLNGKLMHFSGGKGYMEKDWGQAFPSAWIWLQSNHFSSADACITASVATVPWLKHWFRGFIVGFWLEGRLHRFATYTGAKIESLQIHDEHVDWVLRNRTHRLHLKAYRSEGGVLRGPTPTDMGQRVMETLNSTVAVRLETLKGERIFEGDGAHAGLEVVGDLPRLLQG